MEDIIRQVYAQWRVAKEQARQECDSRSRQIWQRNTVCVICSKARKIYRALYGCSQAHKVWSSVSNTVSRI